MTTQLGAGSIVLLLTLSTSILHGQQHFSWTTNTGNNATIAVLMDTKILINGVGIVAGDEIAVFTPDGLCVGGMVYCGERNRAITVWGNNTMTDTVDGIRENEKMHFRVWRHEVDQEYEFTTVKFRHGDDLYRINGIYILDELKVETLPAIPVLKFPANGATLISVNPTLSWSMDELSEHFRVQLARNVDFTDVLVDTSNLVDTWLSLDLEHDTRYYWRVRAYNKFGMSEWSAIYSFSTVVRGDVMMIPLEQGWNLISSYVQPEDPDMGAIFSSIRQNSLVVKNQNGQVYWPDEGINDIGLWDVTHGYHVYVGTDDTLYIYGERVIPSHVEIELYRGWNSLAYLNPHPMEVGHALGSIFSNILLVKTHDGYLFWPEYEHNTITYLEPGRGYYLYLREDAVLVYPDEPTNTKNKTAHSSASIAKVPDSSGHYSRTISRTGESAVYLIRTEFAQEGDEIGVWDSEGKLVGAGTVHDDRAILFVWGNNFLTAEIKDGALEGEHLRLTWYSSEQKQESDIQVHLVRMLSNENIMSRTLRYSRNAIGIVDTYVEAEPEGYVRNFQLSQNYPNPFNPSTNIFYQIPQDAFVRLTVYSITGQEVATLINEEQRAGGYTVSFDASHLASGVYIYRLQAGYYWETKKMILLR